MGLVGLGLVGLVLGLELGLSLWLGLGEKCPGRGMSRGNV